MHGTTSNRVFDDLTDSIEELLRTLADVQSPEIVKIRTKIQIALAAAKSAWVDTKDYASRQVIRTLGRPDEYVRESPWRALALTAVLGIGAGALLMRSREPPGR